ACEQAALADLGTAIAFAERGGLLAQLEGLANARRRQHGESTVILPAQDILARPHLKRAEAVVEPLAQGTPSFQAAGIETSGELQALLIELVFRRLQHFGGEVLVARLATGAERSVGAAEP